MSWRGKALLLITLVDSFVTGIAFRAGCATEFNPTMSWLLINGGEFAFIMFRAMFVLLIIARLDGLACKSEINKQRSIYLYNLAIFFYVTALFVWTGTAQYILNTRSPVLP